MYIYLQSDVADIEVAKTVWGDKTLRTFRKKLLSDDTGLFIPDAEGGKLLLTRVYDFPADSSGNKVSESYWALYNHDISLRYFTDSFRSLLGDFALQVDGAYKNLEDAIVAAIRVYLRVGYFYRHV